MASASEIVNGWAADLRKAGSELKDIAQELVPVVEKETLAAASAQRSLDGVQWKPTLTGKPALQGIGKSLRVYAQGLTIWITMSGYHVFHQFGTSRTPKRPLLPSEGMPNRLGNALARGVVDAGFAFMNRKGSHRKKRRK